MSEMRQPFSAARLLSISGEAQAHAWLSMLRRFALLVRREGLSVQVASSSDASFFMSLSEENRSFVFRNFAGYLEVCEQMIREGLPLKDARSFLWRMLVKFGLRPRSELFSHIADGDLIEIYDENSRQIFRSLNFLPVCSYSLDEVFCRPWWELFDRDPATLERLAKIGQNLLDGQLRDTQFVFDGRHTVDEINSERLLRADVNFKVISPVHMSNDPRCAGFVTVFEVLSCFARK